MYKGKSIAIIFFARSNSKRLKNKLYKKIANYKMIEVNFILAKKIKYVDQTVLATSNHINDDKLEKIAFKHKIKVISNTSSCTNVSIS